MRRNVYLGTSGQKSDGCISTTEWRLRDIFDVFVLLRRMILWPWPLTFWPWDCLMYSAAHVRPTHQFLLFYDYRLLSYEYWIFDHITVIWNSLRMRRVTWPVHRRSPKITRDNFWPRIVYSLYNFYGATMTIKGSLYWSIPMLKQFSVAKKLSKLVPEMADFQKFKGPSIKYSHRDPQKALPYPEQRIWRILRKYPSRGVSLSLIHISEPTRPY